ncbi:tRNA wybutosine-synthesizing protein 2/3/4, partial [Tetrabaena socialis]
MVLDAFQQRKAVVLQGLQAECADKSRKGSVDAPVASLVARINAHPAVYTTSSCSGRITVFGEPTPEGRAGGKKGGEWVYASHDPADPE